MSSIDMNEVVTRGILREELQKELQKELQAAMTTLRQEMVTLNAELRAELRAEMATKSDLEIWAGALVARMDQMFRDQQVLIRQDMTRAVQMVQAQFARDQALALEPMKDLSERVAALEDADLPARVSKLERTAVPPKRTRRRAPR
jgi:hypothetical protein